MSEVEIKFVRTHPDAKLPKANNPSPLTGDTGYDIYSVEDKIIPAKGNAVIDVGLKVGYITPGYWFTIAPRSGLGFKHSIQPHLGIIDNCVPAGTNIRTVDGDIDISKLFSSETLPHIISYNEEKNICEVDSVTDMWTIDDVDLIEIETDDNRVVVASTKPVFTKRGWINAKDLTSDDFILEI